MTLEIVDRLQLHPTSALLGCLVWIPIAFWVVGAVHGMVMGDIDALVGILAIFLGMALAILTIAAPDPRLSPFTFAAGLITAIAYVPLREALRRRALAKIDLEQLELTYERLRLRPEDTAALFKMAEMLYLRGLTGQAVALGQNLLPRMPRDLYEDEHRKVFKWSETLTDPNEMRPIPCLSCGRFNPPGIPNCAGCGREHLLDYARGRWLGPGVGKIIALWGVGVLVFAGLPAWAMIPMESNLKIGGFVLLIFLVLYVLIRAFVRSSNS